MANDGYLIDIVVGGESLVDSLCCRRAVGAILCGEFFQQRHFDKLILSDIIRCRVAVVVFVDVGTLFQVA